MSKKINHELVSHYLNKEDYFENKTLFVEFARGGKEGFKKTFEHFDESVLKRAAIFFIDNTAEESERRNQARYDAQSTRSILAHKTPDSVMKFYRTNDWKELTKGDISGYLNVKGVNVPYISAWNIPELDDHKLIEERFAPHVIKLWELYNNR